MQECRFRRWGYDMDNMKLSGDKLGACDLHQPQISKYDVDVLVQTL